MLLGKGSNILVRDGGIAGAVIRLGKGEFQDISVSGETIFAGAGVRFKQVSNVARNNGIAGFEWMEGIPGSVGGGLRMNAGAMGTQAFDQVVSQSRGGFRTRPPWERLTNAPSVPSSPCYPSYPCAHRQGL